MYSATIDTDEEEVNLNQLHPTASTMLIYAIQEAEAHHATSDWIIRVFDADTGIHVLTSTKEIEI